MMGNFVNNTSIKYLGKVLNVGGIWIFSLVFLFPFFWMITNAIRPSGEVFSLPPRFFPQTWQWENFYIAWTQLPFARFFFNSFVVSVAVVFIFVSTSILAAFAFSRLRWKYREVVFMSYLSTLMVPSLLLVIPLFLVVNKLGWVNTYAGLIIPVAFGSYAVFLLRQFFLGIPIELEEAARIDGASNWRILIDVIVPLSIPSIGLVTLFAFISSWSSFIWPLIVVNDSDYATLPVGLTLFQTQMGTDWNYIMAGSAISMIPGIILAVLLQKFIYNGLALNTGFGGR
ncbi:carbohydrate ABC transporter permease [Vibrio sp. SCSIO 43132]|uniref:carbohydrate ABC transporter permease n=1 Tax=Vibrio sp. SCSIO 43132 TaxID=2779363 RepID=UPI001CA7DDE6|nr:carbohydrate ABC transporter permease [Vibrio sp. SCSIO 43132]